MRAHLPALRHILSPNSTFERIKCEWIRTNCSANWRHRPESMRRSNGCPRSTPTNSNRPQGPHSMAQSAQRLMQAPEGSLLAAAFNGKRLRYHVLGLPVYRYSASWIGKKGSSTTAPAPIHLSVPRNGSRRHAVRRGCDRPVISSAFHHRTC